MTVTNKSSTIFLRNGENQQTIISVLELALDHDVDQIGIDSLNTAAANPSAQLPHRKALVTGCLEAAVKLWPKSVRSTAGGPRQNRGGTGTAVGSQHAGFD